MTYEPTLDDYIQQLLHDPKPSVRQNAAFILGRQRDMRVIASLLQAANDTDATVRMRVVESLGAWKSNPEYTRLGPPLSTVHGPGRPACQGCRGDLDQAQLTCYMPSAS